MFFYQYSKATLCFDLVQSASQMILQVTLIFPRNLFVRRLNWITNLHNKTEVMTSYRPAVFSSARTAGLIHRPVAIQRSRVAHATRAPDRLAPPYTTRRGILFKTLGLAPVISSSHSLSRVPLYLLYPLEQPLDSPIHRRASSDPQRGISRILKWRLISGQFHPIT